MTTSHSDRVAALVARFPRLFRGQEPDIGIAVGRGWDALLIELLENIDRLLDDRQTALFQIRQIKEKFASLRVYYQVGGSREMVIDLISPEGVVSIRKPPEAQEGFPRKAIDELIAQAAARARVTCERCGNPGKPRPGPWIQVLCDRCTAELASSRDDDEPA